MITILIIGLIFGLLKLGLFLALVIFILSLVTKTKFKDWLSPTRWKSVLVFVLKWLLAKLGDTSPALLQPYEIEQYMFRIKSCEKCLPTNKCENCGCNTIARMNVTLDQCSAGRWGPFVDEASWEQAKKDLGIEFKVLMDNQEIQNIDF